MQLIKISLRELRLKEIAKLRLESEVNRDAEQTGKNHSANLEEISDS